MWWHGLGCVAIKMGTSDMDEKLSWLMERKGWGASFRFPPLPALNSNLRQWRPQRQWSVTLFDTAQNAGNGQTIWLGHWSASNKSTANVWEHRTWLNIHYMMTYTELIIVHVKHGPRGCCEYMKRFVVDLPTRVQATFPVEIWLERGQYQHTSHGF